MPTSDQSDFQRGHKAGGVDERLAGHDKHFDRINGSIEDLSTRVGALVTEVQRLADQAIARDATVLTTAAALKEAEEARRAKSESAWTPLARLISVAGVLIGVVGIFLAIYANAGK